ncbi:MAG: tetraacyldisaccharide 4'-kinase [Alphaproteobacteria bacterium]|nr:tetraacyldisaccharide 4'-kinase [Alphaproteobacteria bacterium]
MTLLLWVVWALIAPPLMVVSALHPRLRGAWAARWGFVRPAVEPGAILVHGASVGEGRAAEAVLAALRRALAPAPEVLLRTAFTDTGLATARGHDALGVLPFDAPWVVGPWLDRVRPRALVLIEAELWPGLLLACRRRRVPVIVAGARAGRGLARLVRWRPLRRLVQRGVSVWLATDDGASERLARWDLGPVGIVGDPKLDVPTPSASLQLPRPLLIGASTRPGDEAALLDALDALPGVHLLLAPRHPARFEAVAASLDARGLPWQRRTALGEGPPTARVLLLDTLGELGGLCAQADAVFIGGTFDPAIGGHSPAEATAAGAPVVAGPHRGANAAAFAAARLSPAASPAALAPAIQRALAAGRGASVSSGAADRVARVVVQQLGPPPPERVHRPWLLPVAALWSAIVKGALQRRAAWARPADVPVVSVGNLDSGGTGKTQVVAWLVDALAERRPVVLSRGYGRDRTGPALRDGRTRADAAWLGDEPAMLQARGAAVISAPDRVAGLAEAARQGAGVAVLDDGLQRTDVPRQVEIVVVDALHPAAGGVIPAGRAREPLAALGRADVVWVFGASAPEPVRRHARPGAVQVLARTEAIGWRRDGELLPPGALQGVEVLAFAGVARPGRFLRLLVEGGVRVARWRTFPDHHRFTAAELAGLRGAGLPLVTTEKDLARIPDPEGIWALAVTARPHAGEAALRALLAERLGGP